MLFALLIETKLLIMKNKHYNKNVHNVNKGGQSSNFTLHFNYFLTKAPLWYTHIRLPQGCFFISI